MSNLNVLDIIFLVLIAVVLVSIKIGYGFGSVVDKHTDKAKRGVKKLVMKNELQSDEDDGQEVPVGVEDGE